MPGGQNWADLRQRTLSGLVIAAVSLALLVLGDVWFQMLAIFAAAVMIWELWMMINPHAPQPGMLLAALSASVLSGLISQANLVIVLLFLVIPIIGAAITRRERVTFFCFALGIQLACWGLIVFREENGALWILWLVLVVVVTDIAGYFAGRLIGGPKFWPSLSPKKTWSGTSAGWIAAGLVGLAFWSATGAGWIILPLSVLLSFASQVGDLTESALKRRMGVKDSSALIPGHGGLFDRFDGLLGAALAMLVIAELIEGVRF